MQSIQEAVRNVLPLRILFRLQIEVGARLWQGSCSRHDAAGTPSRPAATLAIQQSQGGQRILVWFARATSLSLLVPALKPSLKVQARQGTHATGNRRRPLEDGRTGRRGRTKPSEIDGLLLFRIHPPSRSRPERRIHCLSLGCIGN